MQRFIDQLLLALRAYVYPYLDKDVFHDRSLLEGGTLYNRSFARALCRSVCMITVYTPTYFDRDNTYCAREYRAMELIEEHRLSRVPPPALDHHGLIIPIIFRGRPPTHITCRRTCKYDFSRFNLCSDDITRHQQYADWFDEIGRYIRDLYNSLLFHAANGADDDLESFNLPSDDDIAPLLDEIMPSVQQPFPGRLVRSAQAGRFTS